MATEKTIMVDGRVRKVVAAYSSGPGTEIHTIEVRDDFGHAEVSRNFRPGWVYRGQWKFGVACESSERPCVVDLGEACESSERPGGRGK